jgi:hypothetical protein
MERLPSLADAWCGGGNCYSIQLSYGRVEGGLYRPYTHRLWSMCLAPESDALFYRKSIKINKMVGPEGLEPSTCRL